MLLAAEQDERSEKFVPHIKQAQCEVSVGHLVWIFFHNRKEYQVIAVNKQNDKKNSGSKGMRSKSENAHAICKWRVKA